jgi:N-acetylmuramic acid 6-phosphate (MurNAc-6-P) etherase
MGILELLINIEKEDKSVLFANEKVIPQMKEFVSATVAQMKKGRMFTLVRVSLWIF